MLAGGMEKCNLIFCFGQNSVGMIDADLRTGVNTILAFPEFDQPCFVPIIKIDRKGIENHLKPGRHIVVEPGIAGGFLPGVRGGRKETTAAVKDIAERFGQFFQERTFPAFVHAADASDNLFFADMAEEYAEQYDQK